MCTICLLTWPILHGFTANIWQNFTEARARKGKLRHHYRYQYRQFFLMCQSLAHKRELSVLLFAQCCESTATHVRMGTWRGAITQETDLSRVELVAEIPTSSSASYSGWLNSFPLAYRCCFLRVWSIIEEVKLRFSRNKQTPASRKRMKRFSYYWISPFTCSYDKNWVERP